MSCFPLFMELEGREVLVCGGSGHALEKLQRLAHTGARLRVVSPCISQTIQNLNGITFEERPFEERDLDSGPAFVIAAESSEENLRIRSICQAHHVLVNAVDQPEACDLIFPALVSAGELSIGICTGGRSPTVAVMLKEQIRELIPDHIAEILDWLPSARNTVWAAVEDRAAQRSALRGIAAKCFELDRPLTPDELKAFLL